LGSILPDARKHAGVYQLQSRFITPSELSSLEPSRLLGVFLFQEQGQSLPHGVPRLSPGFSPFPQQPEIEVWLSPGPVVFEQVGPLKMAYDGKTLFGTLSLPDTDDVLHDITQEAYRSIFQNTERLGYPNLFRMWNYLPHINEMDNSGLERYKAFCRGRARAFFSDRTFGETFLPAGTGVGSRSGGLDLAFMASVEKIQVNLENPVQVPAYHYPPQYGPRSPSFARGTWVHRAKDAGEFYVSGTASIIGHETLHQDDITLQCETSLKNIERLISSENLLRYELDQNLTLRDLNSIRIYIRRHEDYPVVKRICEAHFNPAASVVYLGADICRTDLLVEIEGWIQKPLEGGPCF